MPDSNLRRIKLDEFCSRLKSSMDVPDCRYIFFLGAGCSVTSGIPDAGTLVKKEWLPKLYKLCGGDIEYEKWIKTEFPNYDSNNPSASYGLVMERLFLCDEDRQQEIERLCEYKFPDYGYAILSKLISTFNGRFNIIITSNFDDLMADAIYLFTQTKPLVINHDSLSKFIRPTRTRPLIVKLHGDSHLSPLNTELDTRELKEEFQKNISPLLNDRGLIFIGYGGNDHGIKQWLENLNERALPYGVYWISGAEPSCELKTWLINRKAIWVQHFDFNEIMLMFHNIFQISLPQLKIFAESIENKIFETYKKVVNPITQTANTPDTIILKKAVDKTDKELKGVYFYLREAQRYVGENNKTAESVYLEGLNLYPRNVLLHNDYAVFLVETIKDYKKAELHYKRGLRIDPDNLKVITNYANFLTYRKHTDFDKAEFYYKRALEIEPNNGITLYNYALFLANIRKNNDQAEEYLKRAMEIDPNNAEILGTYAAILGNIRKEYDQAEEYFKRVLEIDPNNSYNLSNFAGLLLGIGKKEEGIIILEKVISKMQDIEPIGLKAEIWFYAFAFWPSDKRTIALHKLKQILLEGARSLNWDFSMNLQQAKKDSHPEIEWLYKLADVINGKADISVLNDWLSWKKA